MNMLILSSRSVLTHTSALNCSRLLSSCLYARRPFSSSAQSQLQEPSTQVEIVHTDQSTHFTRSEHNIVHKLKLNRPKKEKDPVSHFSSDTLELENVRVKVYDKITDRDESKLPFDEKPVPNSPKFYPYTIKNPLMYPKTYFWCSCGMSMKQPFCDNSHTGSSFKPIKFGLDQQVKQMHLCGCKFSINAPYCDGQTCVGLRSGESFEQIQPIEESVQEEQEERKEIPSIRQKLLDLTGQSRDREQIEDNAESEVISRSERLRIQYQTQESDKERK